MFHLKTFAYVHNTIVKDILTRLDSEEKRGHWIEKIMEYDVEIRPTKLVKGQGIRKVLE